MYFGKNLRYLREKHGKPSQEKLGKALGLTRSAVSSYEDGRAEAKYEILQKISAHFNVSVDNLLSKDLSKLDEHEALYKQDTQKHLKGNNLRVLSITTDNSEEGENIESVPIKASAGYTMGYADPEYIRELPKYRIPFLPKNKTYRAFEIQGDSMLPARSGSVVIGEYLEDWSHIKPGQECIVVTKNMQEGVVFKKVYLSADKSKFTLKSNNINYATYEVGVGDVVEIWKFTVLISKHLPDDAFQIGDLKEAYWRLEDDIRLLKSKQNGFDN